MNAIKSWGISNLAAKYKEFYVARSKLHTRKHVLTSSHLGHTHISQPVISHESTSYLQSMRFSGTLATYSSSTMEACRHGTWRRGRS